MKYNSDELLAVLRRFKDIPMVVLGDIIVDHYIWGTVDRISPEAPVVVVQVKEENRRLGGAANVANNLVALGAKVSLIGVVGVDEYASQLRGMLAELGIEEGGLVADPSRPTTVKTRVVAHAQQVVRVDREVTRPLDAALQQQVAQSLYSHFEGAKGIIVSDYAKGVVCPPLFSAIERGYQEGKLGLGNTPILVDPKAPNFPLYTRASIVKPNRKEAEAASGRAIANREEAVIAGRELLQRWNAEMLLITMGDKGMVLVDQGDSVVEVDTVAREVYDVSGAGDTVSAVFMLSLAAGATPRTAAILANIAAGIVVAEIGTAAVSLDELEQEVRRGGGTDAHT